jgi:hypothetical protein
MTTRAPLLAVLPVLFTACAYPGFVAKKTVQLDIAAENLTAVDCESHNGAITVVGDTAATKVDLRVELSVRGHTQEEADANLGQLDFTRDVLAGKLTLRGTCPHELRQRMSPSFAFTLTTPPAVALRLQTHNGDIGAKGTTGAIDLETHNGSIRAAAANGLLIVRTHNGEVDLTVDHAGPVNGSIESHNGSVTVGFGERASAALEASTHNGSIQTPKRLQDATITRSSLRCRIGDGQGKLVVTTHNGNVAIRD